MNNGQELPLINPSLIEENPKQFWEQVLSFLYKKDKKIEEQKNFFWNKIIPVLENALLKEEYLDKLEIPMKKNESNTNYDTVVLYRDKIIVGVTSSETSPEEIIDVFDFIISYKYDNEDITKEELKNKWDINDIIIFSKNLINVFEILHDDRNNKLKNIIITNTHLKQELNVNGLHI